MIYKKYLINFKEFKGIANLMNLANYDNYLVYILVLISLYIPNYNCSISFKNDLRLTRIQEQNLYYTAKVGDTISLPCHIENLKGSTVIWQYSKTRLPETLTIGFLQYRQDYRIRVITNMTSEELQMWNLEIRKVKLEDEGNYTCRVMTEHETLKRQIYLKVEVTMDISPVNPVVNIKDSIIIFCNTSYIPNSDEHNNNYKIEWFKNNESNPLHFYHYNVSGNNYKIEELKSPTLSSKLKIVHIRAVNLGTYICRFRSQNLSTVLKKSTSFNRKHLKVTHSSSMKANSQNFVLFFLIIFTTIINLI